MNHNLKYIKRLKPVVAPSIGTEHRCEPFPNYREVRDSEKLPIDLG